MKSLFTPKEKAAIVKQHFLQAVPIEDICNTYQITPSTFEKWKTNLFENSDLVLLCLIKFWIKKHLKKCGRK